MILGVPKETLTNETRVAVIPVTVKQLTSAGFDIIIESNAGKLSQISDADYIESGAKIVNSASDIFQKSDMILKVNSPSEVELSMLKENSAYISFFQTMKETSKVKLFKDKKITGFSMHLIPRTTLAQKMDALSSQTNIAGYKAVLIGSCHIDKYMPLLMTAAGTISPAKVLVLGAGVAGLSAIATAKRLGAQVEASDVRPEVKEQVESLGAKFLEVKSETEDGVGEGGYAKETSDEYKKKQAQLLNEKGSYTINDVLENINTKLNGVTIDGTVNLAGTMSVHASQLYSKNVCAFLLHGYDKDSDSFNFDDEIVSGSMFTHMGEIVDERTKGSIEEEN